MPDFVMPLMLDLDVSSLTMSLVNIASPVGGEAALADSVEAALDGVAHLSVERAGNTVVARCAAGAAERVVVAVPLSTASEEPEPLAYVEMGKLFGPGASGTKGPLAVALKTAAAGGFQREVTFVFHTGLADVPDEVLRGSVAVIGAPTASRVISLDLAHPELERLVSLTDVAPLTGRGPGLDRFASLGVPAAAFGPGDESAVGTAGEFVPTADLSQCEFVLRQWLTSRA